MFADAAFCGRCGARRSRFEEPSAARCPACRGAMQSVTVGAATVLECSSCDGLWLDAEGFERICVEREAQAAVLHRGDARAPAIETRVSYRPCVRCGTMMTRVNFARLSGTIVDVCKGHGTFLDRGELQAIVAFIQGGGLDRARERQIEDLKEQERRLKDLANRRVATQYESRTDSLRVHGAGITFDSLISLFREI